MSCMRFVQDSMNPKFHRKLKVILYGQKFLVKIFIFPPTFVTEFKRKFFLSLERSHPYPFSHYPLSGIIGILNKELKITLN
jgi:hypothetical protein